MSKVTVEAPTKSKIEPKLGTDSAMNKRQRTEKVLKAQRFQLKSGEIKSFDSGNNKARISSLDGTLSISSKN